MDQKQVSYALGLGIGQNLLGMGAKDINIDEYAAKTEGYIASDIAFIVNDAAMTAAFTRKPINHELMCTSLNNIKPSLQKEVIEEYSQIRNKMNGVQRRAVVQSL